MALSKPKAPGLSPVRTCDHCGDEVIAKRHGWVTCHMTVAPSENKYLPGSWQCGAEVCAACLEPHQRREHGTT